MEKGIRLSKKYGLNPSILHCEVCGSEIGIGLFGTGIKNEHGQVIEAPRIMYHGLCDKCQEVVDADGLLCIECYPPKTSEDKPERTGRVADITKEAKDRIFGEINTNICYLEDKAFQQLFGKQYNEEKDKLDIINQYMLNSNDNNGEKDNTTSITEISS